MNEKKLLKAELLRLNLQYDKLSAKTVGFSDLARCSMVFVAVHGAKGWQPTDWDTIELFARKNGFRIQP